ncbi:MAG: hypothetical protein WC869_06240 [Phycisphaerae bacterium]|jgi:hypothetical protein
MRHAILFLLGLTCTTLPLFAAGANASSGQVRQFPNAGIELAIPAGYQLQPLAQPYEILRAVMFDGNTPSQGLTLVAMPVGSPTATADEIADSMLADQQQSLVIRDLQMITKATMKVADINGAARYFSYKFRGEPTLAAVVYFIRQAPDSASRICYILSVEAQANRKSEVLPALGDVVKTVQFLPLQRPIDIKLHLGQKVESEDGLLSLRVPEGWFVNSDASGLEIAQMDFTRNTPTLFAHIVVDDVAPQGDANAVAAKCIARFKTATAADEMEGKVLGQTTSLLAGLPACQLVMEQRGQPRATSAPTTAAAGATTAPATVPASSPATAPAADADKFNVVIVQRVVVLPESLAAGGHKSLSLILICQEAKPEAAEAAMNTLAEGFELHPEKLAATQPTPAPGNVAPAKK